MRAETARAATASAVKLAARAATASAVGLAARAATAGMVGLALLTACGGSQPPATPADRAALAAAAAQRQPVDPELADLYIHACRNCHANAASGAPLTDDREAWRPRWQQGPALLLAHTLQGFNGMPAGGQCPRCTVRDYEALIRFMAHQ